MKVSMLAVGLCVVAGAAMAAGPEPKTIVEVAAVKKPLAGRSAPMPREFAALDSVGGEVNANCKIAKPTIITREEWGALPTSGTLSSHFPVAITIHHGGDKLLVPGSDVVPGIKALQKFSQNTKGWCDIPYHYMIDDQGRIYEARPWNIPGDTNTSYDPNRHLLIELIGNYEQQAPTLAQMKAVVALSAWGCDYFNIDPATIAGHVDYVPTQCPGQYYYPYVISGSVEGDVRREIREAYKAK